MLLGADHRGLGLDRPTAAPVSASPLFVGISTALVIAVNIRTLGTLWAVFMVALCLAILYLGRKGMIERLVRQPILILLPCLFPLSCLWSDMFTVSLSLGLQTLLVTLTAITIAQCTSNQQFLLITFLAVGAVCIACLIHGGQGASAHGPVLIGFLGSKDAMGLFAYSGVMASLALMLDKHYSGKLRLLAVAVGAVEFWIATNVNATAALISLILGIGIFLLVYFLLAKFKIMRWASYAIMLTLVLAILAFASELAQLFLQFADDHLGKDATLTGRTLLWDKAMELAHDAPILGHGYREFWVGPDLGAKRLLAMQGVTDGRGFHFHQQYLEVLVDTGLVGLTALVLTLAVFTQRIWKSAVVSPSYFSAYAFAVMAVYMTRLVLETSFLPFSFDMMMIYGLAAAAMKPRTPPPEESTAIGATSSLLSK